MLNLFPNVLYDANTNYCVWKACFWYFPIVLLQNNFINSSISVRNPTKVDLQNTYNLTMVWGGTQHSSPISAMYFVWIHHRTSLKWVLMFSKLILNPDIEWEQVVRKGIAQKIILFYGNGFRLLFGRSGPPNFFCYITIFFDFPQIFDFFSKYFFDTNQI